MLASSYYFTKSITPGQYTMVHLILNQLNWAVPAFLMITGALLLNPEKEIPLKKLFGKYIRRVLLALIVFTFVFQGIDLLFHEEHEFLIWSLKNLAFGTGWPHMWYLYLMIFLYLLMPFFKAFTKTMNDRMLVYLIILMLAFNSLMPILNSFGFETAYDTYSFIIYPIYLFLGYLIHKKGLPRVSSIVLLICGTVGILLASLAKQSEGMRALYDYGSPFVIMQAMGIFGLFDSWDAKGLHPVIRFFDSTTFGVYLIHMAFVKIIMKFLGFNPYAYGLWIFIFIVIIFFIASSLLTCVIRKIPKLQLL
jgi:surface polysaccharide O-acyltransferase-like enzyme